MYYSFWNKLSSQQQKDFPKENLENCLEMVTYLGEPDVRLSVHSFDGSCNQT